MLIQLPIHRVRSIEISTICWCHFAAFSILQHYPEEGGETLPLKHLAAVARGLVNPPYDIFKENLIVFGKLCEKFQVRTKHYFVARATERVDGVANISIGKARESVKESLSKRLPMVVWGMRTSSRWGQETVHAHAMVIYGIRMEREKLLVHDPNTVASEDSVGADFEPFLADLFEDRELGISWLTTFRKALV